MGHRAERGEPSTYEKGGGKHTEGYLGKHRREIETTPLDDRPSMEETTQIVNGGWFGKKK